MGALYIPVITYRDSTRTSSGSYIQELKKSRKPEGICFFAHVEKIMASYNTKPNMAKILHMDSKF